MTVEQLKPIETFNINNLIFFPAREISVLDSVKQMFFAGQVSPLLQTLGGEHMFHPSPEEIQEFMKKGQTVLMADSTTENLVGFAKTDIWTNASSDPVGYEVGSLIVVPQFQNKGIGKFLVTEMAKTTFEMACGLPVFSVVTNDNASSLALYRHLRWQEISYLQSLNILKGVDILDGWIPPSTIFLYDN